MSDTLYAVYGASGFGREVMPLLRSMLACNHMTARLVFVDDGYVGDFANEYQVLSYNDFLAQPEKHKKACIAIANSKVREQLAEKLLKDKVEVIDVEAFNVCKLDDVVLEQGSILCPFVTLTSNIKVGRHFHANIYSYIAHDCVIGDYVTFAPRVNCNGNVHIHDHAYIGTGAVLKQGTPDKPLIIGRGAVVGMGAVVTKDVPDGAVVVGNPAKPLAK